MNSTAVQVLSLILDGSKDRKRIIDELGIGEQQLDAVLKQLENLDYVENKETLQIRANAKTILFRDIARNYDIHKILHDSNEKIFYLLSEPMTAKQISSVSDLSDTTVLRIIKELESIGCIVRKNNTISIDPSKESLLMFAKILKKEAERGIIEDYASVIYKDRIRILKSVPKGRPAHGELTAFSLFSEYGIDYLTVNDYYVRQSSGLTFDDILIHSILIARKQRDKNAMSIIILLYLKNRNKLDTLNMRTIARTYDILDIWLDIEAFVRYGQVKNNDIFPNREEFEEKAKLYEIPDDVLELPKAYPELFDEIGKKLPRDFEVYLLGGENMRIRNLKDRTKDCDIVVKDQKAFRTIIKILKNIGYESINGTNYSPEDDRIGPSDILRHGSRSRIDIFTNIIGKKIYLSSRMMKRAEIKRFGHLLLGILKIEDVFLLKAVTDREGDIHDMQRLAQSEGFNWDMVWDELERQQKETRYDLYSFFIEQIDDLIEQTGIRPPFYRKLIRNVIDSKIERLIRDQGKPLDDILKLLETDDVPQKMIRNRIDYLERMKHLRKRNIGDRIIILPRKANVLNIPSIDPVGFEKRLNEHLQSLMLKLNLSYDMESEIRELASLVSSSSHFIGFRPRNLAAAIVYVSAIRRGRNLTADDISYFGGVSKPSIYGLSKQIRALIHSSLNAEMKKALPLRNS